MGGAVFAQSQRETHGPEHLRPDRRRMRGEAGSIDHTDERGNFQSAHAIESRIKTTQRPLEQGSPEGGFYS